MILKIGGEISQNIDVCLVTFPLSKLQYLIDMKNTLMLREYYKNLAKKGVYTLTCPIRSRTGFLIQTTLI